MNPFRYVREAHSSTSSVDHTKIITSTSDDLKGVNWLLAGPGYDLQQRDKQRQLVRPRRNLYIGQHATIHERDSVLRLGYSWPNEHHALLPAKGEAD